MASFPRRKAGSTRADGPANHPPDLTGQLDGNEIQFTPDHGEAPEVTDFFFDRKDDPFASEEGEIATCSPLTIRLCRISVCAIIDLDAGGRPYSQYQIIA